MKPLVTIYDFVFPFKATERQVAAGGMGEIEGHRWKKKQEAAGARKKGWNKCMEGLRGSGLKIDYNKQRRLGEGRGVEEWNKGIEGSRGGGKGVPPKKKCNRD